MRKEEEPGFGNDPRRRSNSPPQTKRKNKGSKRTSSSLQRSFFKPRVLRAEGLVSPVKNQKHRQEAGVASRARRGRENCHSPPPYCRGKAYLQGKLLHVCLSGGGTKACPGNSGNREREGNHKSAVLALHKLKGQTTRGGGQAVRKPSKKRFREKKHRPSYSIGGKGDRTLPGLW